MKILKKSATAIALSIIAAQAVHADYRHHGRDSRVRCQRTYNQFVLNAANVNTLVASACAALSHTENERKQMQYEDSATMFHQWKTITQGSKVHSTGTCAVNLPTLKSGEYNRHKIDITFEEIQTESGNKRIKADGVIAGKSLDISFDTNEFLDSGCASSEMKIDNLSQVAMGWSVTDMLRSMRTGMTLSAREQRDWTQGRNTNFFSGVGLNFEASNMVRRLGLAIVSDSSDVLVGRSAVLAGEAGGNYFDIEQDSFGHSKGFSNKTAGNNHRFQATSIAGGSQVVGCSALVFESELSRSEEVDLQSCKAYIAKSPLARFTSVAVAPVGQTADEVRENRRKYEMNVVIQKLQDYLSRNHGRAGNYSDRPGMYEGGRVAWSSADKSRGFVIQQRNYQIDATAGVARVTEHRSNSSGSKSIKRYTILLDKI